MTSNIITDEWVSHRLFNVYNINQMAKVYDMVKHKLEIQAKYEFIRKAEFCIHFSYSETYKLNRCYVDYFNDIATHISFQDYSDKLFYLYYFSNFIPKIEIINTIDKLLKTHTEKLDIIDIVDFIDSYFPELKSHFNSYVMLVKLIEDSE